LSRNFNINPYLEKDDLMNTFLNFLVQGFLMPGTVVIRKIGVSVEDDGGILRSFINMCFWGTISLLLALGIYG